MKHLLILGFALFLTISNISCTAQDNKSANSTAKVAKKVEVYYFHYTRRCMTCNKVEEESKKALEALYPEQMKSGAISFQSVNLDEDSSKPIAEKCNASGQSLLIISGSNKTDLTSQGFMYATSNSAKLTEEIKKVVDPLLAKK
ncbi:MAG: hypothetical protein IPO21_13200 [Bacteroidales bacterium]|nr:hypothetical protein [Bacteroidales bacterium]